MSRKHGLSQVLALSAGLIQWFLKAARQFAMPRGLLFFVAGSAEFVYNTKVR